MRLVGQRVICPYCGKPAKFVDSSVVYGRSYGMIYDCRPCDAYVGVHALTTRPKGTLANRETRAARKAAHAAFDPVWEALISQGNRKTWSRGRAYARLSAALGIPIDECHIGMFDAATCRRVVEACRAGLPENTLKTERTP